MGSLSKKDYFPCKYENTVELFERKLEGIYYDRLENIYN